MKDTFPDTEPAQYKQDKAEMSGRTDPYREVRAENATLRAQLAEAQKLIDDVYSSECHAPLIRECNQARALALRLADGIRRLLDGLEHESAVQALAAYDTASTTWGTR